MKKPIDEASQLPPTQREALAEIERRIAELDQGKVEPIPWVEARRMIFGDADDSVQD